MRGRLFCVRQSALALIFGLPSRRPTAIHFFSTTKLALLITQLSIGQKASKLLAGALPVKN
jgi:hypothetical protein